MRKILQKVFIVISLFLMTFVSSERVLAREVEYEETTLRQLGIQFVERGSFFDCSASGSGTPGVSGTNLDYAGNPVLTDGQLELLAQNQAVYQQVGEETDIPWQTIAVIHKNESGFGRSNPANGQGIYQFVSGAGGPYPTGPVDDLGFLSQTRFMAERLKSDYSQRTPIAENRGLSANGTPPDNLKDTFFSYNGRSTSYADQAAAKGFNRDTQPFEGSPYVMNRFDQPRDPTVEPTRSDRTWGQIKRDFGGIEYPANSGHGAYTTYVAIGGESNSANECNIQSGSAERILQVARAELQLDPVPSQANGGHLKYTGGIDVAWCAYFASWVFDQAGKPLEGGPIGSVDGIKAMAIANGYWHPRDEANFEPQPGDIVVYDEGLNPYPSHVNIVESYDAATQKITTIGGNESDTIKRYEWDRFLAGITGFVRIP